MIGPGEPIPDGTHERARMVIQFSKVDSASISMTLRAVFGIAGPSVTGKSVVEVGGTNQIVVTASLRDLRSVRALAEHLDTVSPIPKKPRKTTPSD